MTNLPPIPSAYLNQPAATSGPIVTSLPSTTAAFTRKYQTLAPQLNQLPPAVVNALYQYDQQRAMRGAQPLGKQQTFNVLSSALTGQAATPEKQRGTGIFNLPGNAIHDLSTILASIPRLPHAIAQEITQLPQVPEDITNALAQPTIGSKLAALTETPGIRMVPGAYTVHNVASGQPGEILRHPLMTLLDIYPAAKQVGLTGKLAEQISTVSGKVGELTPVKDLAQTVRGNRGYQFLQELSSKEARQVASENYRFDKLVERDFENSPQLKFGVEAHNTLTEPERIQATTAATMNQAAIDALPDHLQPFANQIRLQADLMADVGTQEGIVSKAQNYGGQGYTEILDNKTFRKWTAKNQLATIAKMEGEIRNAIIDPVASGHTPESLSTLGAQAAAADAGRFGGVNGRLHYLRGITHALDSLGYDAKVLRDAINESAPQVPRNRRLSSSQLADVFQQFPNRANQLTPVPDSATILDNFRPAARRDPKIAVFTDHLNRGNYQAALEVAKQIDKRSTFRPDDWEQVVESTRRLRDQSKYLTSDPVFTEKKVNSIVNKLEKFERNNYPAKYKPEITRRALDKVARIHAEEPDWPTISKLIAEKNFSQYPGLTEEVAKAMNEVGRTWQQIRDESPIGEGPAFVHEVSPSAAQVMLHPQVLPKNLNESWANRRTNDLTSAVPDAAISIPHQAFELIRRQRSEQYVDFLEKTHGSYAEQPMEFLDDNGNLVTKPAIIDEFLDRARRKYPDDPSRVRIEVERLMRREYGEFDPSRFGFKGAKLTNLGKQDTIWMRKTVLRNLERMATPLDNGFTALLDPTMNAFRVSVLGLSPRFQVNNLVGGGIIAAVEDPGILTHFFPMVKMFREAAKGTGEVSPEIQAVADRIGIGTGQGQLPRESLIWGKNEATLLHQFMAGRTLGRLFDEAGGAVGKAIGGVTERAFKLNQFVDDAYRAAAYMRGYEKAGVGLSEVERIEAGVHLARKVLQRWDEITPLERSIMRYTFPFYGWMKHIVPYVLRYPFDHPWRAEIFSNFARNERNDLGTGLPDRFLNAFFLGHPDKNGNIKAIQVGGMNPFSGVANYMTWQGFVGNLNPVAQAVLEALGVDTQSGGPELFPEISYDPESGRVVNRGKSFLPALVANVIPQSQILTAMLGANGDFKSLLQSNPEAAARQLISAGGFPLLYRSFNLPEEQFKAELARESAQNAAKSKALKSGNLDSLNQYPALRGYVAQLQALQAQGKLAPYNPNQQQASILAALGQAANPL